MGTSVGTGSGKGAMPGTRTGWAKSLPTASATIKRVDSKVYVESEGKSEGKRWRWVVSRPPVARLRAPGKLACVLQRCTGSRGGRRRAVLGRPGLLAGEGWQSLSTAPPVPSRPLFSAFQWSCRRALGRASFTETLGTLADIRPLSGAYLCPGTVTDVAFGLVRSDFSPRIVVRVI